MSIDRRTSKEDVVCVHIYLHTHTHTILLSHKKERYNVICSQMDGPRGYHTKWNKSDREKQISYDIISGNFKKWYRELIYKTEMD